MDRCKSNTIHRSQVTIIIMIMHHNTFIKVIIRIWLTSLLISIMAMATIGIISITSGIISRERASGCIES
ncbi:hypothetical protein N9L68_07230, partial [bacterium]|nr:hypothetical protein [bacterium]